MQHKVRFDLYRQPTALKQISAWPYGLGIVLAILTVVIFYAGKFLPPELLMLYIFEVIGEFVLHLLALSAIFITTGIILKELGWRNGILMITEDRIQIIGRMEFDLNYDEITRFRYLGRRTLQIRTSSNPVLIRFKESEIRNRIGSLLEERNPGITQLMPGQILPESRDLDN